MSEGSSTMHTAAFLPWFAIDADSEVGGCSLLRYERGHRPSGQGAPDQQRLDFAIGAFRERGKPIGAATVFRVGKGSPTRDLDDEELNQVFQLVEMLATAALAGRDYFQAGSSYCNRDAFRLVVQSVPAQVAGGWCTVTRRRDGSSTNVYPAALPEVRPPYIASGRTGSLDNNLLEALVAIRVEDPRVWDRVWDAITSFNAANTDSDRTTKGQEIVLTFGAIQRLLGGSHRIKEFAPVFESISKPSRDESSPLELADKYPDTTVRGAWICDLARVRNAFGHGKSAPDSAPFWTVNEHLLFGAYVFPLLLKRLLAASGVYAVTRRDEQDANLFEKLLLCKPFDVSQHGDHDDDWVSPWQRVRRAALWSEILDVPTRDIRPK